MLNIPLGWFLFAAATSPGAMRPVAPHDRAARPVAEIDIAQERVFQIDDGPAAPLAKIGNALHVDTRERVIRDLLLFGKGDLVTAELAQEAERVLRESGLFVNARVTLRALGDSAYVRVTTRDVWSTQVIARYRTDAGVEELSLGAVENNFLGFGDALSGIYRWSDDEDVFTAGFQKRRFLGPYGQLGVSYGESDESLGRAFALAQPDYSDFAPWSGALSGSTYDGNVTLYRGGVKSGRYRTHQDFVTAYANLYRVARVRWRVGLGFVLDDERALPIEGDAFAIDDDRPLRNDRRRQLSAAIGVMDRRYLVVRNVDRIGEEEDLALGYVASIIAGAELEGLGSSADRPYLSFFGRHASALGERGAFIVHASTSSFFRGGELSAREMAVVVKAFSQKWPGQTQAMRFVFHGALDVPPEEVLYVGAGEGLRGFAYRAFRGTRVTLLSLDQRIEPGFHLLGVHLGAAFFADAGAAWEADERLRWKDLRTDVGAGLRVRAGSLLPLPMRLDFGRGLGHDGELRVSFGLGQVFRLVQRVDYPAPVPFRFGSSFE